MRIAVVGRTHPYKGGIAAHTTRTAHALADAGHAVHLVSWSRLYPTALYPGEQAVPAGEAEVEYESTTRPLRWDRPLSRWPTGRSLREVDLHTPWVTYAAAPARAGLSAEAPDTDAPNSDHPDTGHPDTDHPDTSHPDTSHPDADHLDADRLGPSTLDHPDSVGSPS